MPKQLVVILGMHRSGTSLITRSIELLGYSLGDNLMPAGEDNPRGFFEDLDVVAFNDDLLEANYSSWDSPRNSIVGETIAEPSLAARAEELLTKKFENTDKLVIKDPRMSIVMPFWQQLFDRLDIQVSYIAVHRNPLDVAASLTARNGLEKRHGLLLDYIYNRSLMGFLAEDAFVVHYEKFVDQPEGELSRIAGYLGETVDAVELNQFVEEFVDAALTHHLHTDQDLESDPAVFPALIRLSRIMTELAEGASVPVSGVIDSLPQDAGLERELLTIQLRRDAEEKRQTAATERNLREEIQTLEASVSDIRFDFADKASQLKERERHISLLQGEVEELGEKLVGSNQVIAERDQQIHDVIAERKTQIEAVNQQLNSARKTVQHQIQEISQLGDLVSDLYSKDEENRQQIAGYQQHLENYDRIHRDLLNSVSLRLGRLLTYPVRKPFSLLVLSRLKDKPVALRIVGFLRSCLSHPLTTLKLISPRRIRNFYLLLTQRQDLVDQVMANYEEVMSPVVHDQDLGVHHYTDEELAEFHLKFPVHATPVVSVVIPVYNQLDYTLKCLTSIADNLPEVPFEVIIADDCSTDMTSEILSRIEGLNVIRHPENLRFLRSCNRTIDFCKGDYVFLLNNDTVVKPGWLDSLVEVFERYPDAGLAGSKLVYPSGKLQEAGGIVWSDGSAWNFGRLQDPEQPEFNYLREVDYVSGAAIMFPRQLFIDLGRFDDNFAPAYYEDTDLAFKIRAAGKKVYYQPRSVVVHYEGVSHGTDESDGLKQYQLANKEKFEQKWRSVLEAEHFPNGEQVAFARERSRGKTTVLVIDHYVPHFDKDAGSRSTFLYLKLLVEAGCNVKFLGDNFFKHEPYTTALQDLGIEVLYGREYEKTWKSWLRQHASYIDVVYLMRPHIAEKYIDVVNELSPKPKTIYFGHDLHYLRLERQAEVSKDAEITAEANFWKKKEYGLFEKFDLIYYPSPIEVEEIRSNEPDLPVKAIPLYAFDRFDTSSIDFEARQDLLFVGGFNHPPNVDGLLWFVQSVLPGVLKEMPDLRVNVVGSNMPQAVADCASDNVIIRGFLTDQELDELYGSVRLSIVPLRFGAGIKGKVLDAMNRGVPIVTTHVGAEGIPGDALIVADAAEDMAENIIRAYGDQQEQVRLSALGRQIIRDHFSSDAVLKIIADDFMMKVP